MCFIIDDRKYALSIKRFVVGRYFFSEKVIKAIHNLDFNYEDNEIIITLVTDREKDIEDKAGKLCLILQSLLSEEEDIFIEFKTEEKDVTFKFFNCILNKIIHSDEDPSYIYNEIKVFIKYKPYKENNK